MEILNENANAFIGQNGHGYYFWDSQDIIFIDYLEKGKTITGEHYDGLLAKFYEELKKKLLQNHKKKVLLHHGIVTRPFFRRCNVFFVYEICPTNSNFLLFPNMKWLARKKFTSNEEVIAKTGK